jgi:hypothetical protein
LATVRESGSGKQPSTSSLLILLCWGRNTHLMLICAGFDVLRRRNGPPYDSEAWERGIDRQPVWNRMYSDDIDKL